MSDMPMARIGDMHVCPMQNPTVPPTPHVGGPIMSTTAATRLSGGMPLAQVTSVATCMGPPDVISQGSCNILANSMPIGVMTGASGHGGTVVQGNPKEIS